MPPKLLTIRTLNGIREVFDPCRKKYVRYTPEEHVRQHIIAYANRYLGYPLGMISVEKQILTGSRLRRYDVVVYYDKQPWLILECKQQDAVLNESVLAQTLAYASALSARYIAMTNGVEIYVYNTFEQQWLQELPPYPG